MAERSTKDGRSHENIGKHEMYESLAEESTESLEREIMAIERSAGAEPRHGEALESSPGEVNKKTYPDERPRCHSRTWRPHASSKISVTGSSAECVEAKKIASESCAQVSVAPAESVKENSPNQKPQGGC